MNPGDEIDVVVDGEWRRARYVRRSELGNVIVRLNAPLGIPGVPDAVRAIVRRPEDTRPVRRNAPYERGEDTKRPRWAFGWKKQFELLRTDDGSSYLTRWWIVATPAGGICVHRMTAPDARDTVHDHPFSFVSFVLRGGYVEKRRDSKTLAVFERAVRRVNVMRARDAHTITAIVLPSTWTLLFVGPQRHTWGFWTPVVPDARIWLGHESMSWEWTQHEHFDSGHYTEGTQP